MTDLITLSEYKAYKGINSANEDGRYNSLIPAVSNMIKEYCGRTFIDYNTNPKTEYWSSGGDQIFLNEFPIISITSVNESLDNHQTQTTLTENEDFYVDEFAGVIQRAKGYEFKDFFKAVEVVYTGGYSDTPDDLKLAAFSMVEYFFKNQYIQSKSFGSNTIEQLDKDTIPGHIKRTLDMYRANYV